VLSITCFYIPLEKNLRYHVIELNLENNLPEIIFEYVIITLMKHQSLHIIKYNSLIIKVYFFITLVLKIIF